MGFVTFVYSITTFEFYAITISPLFVYYGVLGTMLYLNRAFSHSSSGSSAESQQFYFLQCYIAFSTQLLQKFKQQPNSEKHQFVDSEREIRSHLPLNGIQHEQSD